MIRLLAVGIAMQVVTVLTSRAATFEPVAESPSSFDVRPTLNAPEALPPSETTEPDDEQPADETRTPDEHGAESPEECYDITGCPTGGERSTNGPSVAANRPVRLDRMVVPGQCVGEGG